MAAEVKVGQVRIVKSVRKFYIDYCSESINCIITKRDTCIDVMAKRCLFWFWSKIWKTRWPPDRFKMADNGNIFFHFIWFCFGDLIVDPIFFFSKYFGTFFFKVVSSNLFVIRHVMTRYNYSSESINCIITKRDTCINGMAKRCLFWFRSKIRKKQDGRSTDPKWPTTIFFCMFPINLG